MILEAYDYSESDPLNSGSFVKLFISWDNSQKPTETEVDVFITVYDIPANYSAEIEKSNPLPNDEYEFALKLVNDNEIPEEHDQSLPVVNLSGRPKGIYAGYTGQQGTARANTVAL